MLYIECIKGFQIDGGSLPIMQGEVFKPIKDTAGDDLIFEGVENASLNPGVEIEFTNDQLCTNFKVINIKLYF